MTLEPGQQIVLLDEIKRFDDKDYPVHLNTSGFYVPGRGLLRHIIIATVGYAKDWTAYEGWANKDLPDDVAYRAIAQSGDKIWDQTAMELAKKSSHPDLLLLRYRN